MTGPTFAYTYGINNPGYNTYIFTLIKITKDSINQYTIH